MPSPGSDDALASRAVRGDGQALRELVGRHGDETWRLALHALGGDEDLAGRAVELAWGRVAGELPRRAGVEVRLGLLGIVARSCEHVARDGIPDRPTGTEPWEALTAALVRLPWAQRTAWLLRRTHGLSAREVGVVLDLPELVAHQLVEQANLALSGERRGPNVSPTTP